MGKRVMGNRVVAKGEEQASASPGKDGPLVQKNHDRIEADAERCPGKTSSALSSS